MVKFTRPEKERVLRGLRDQPCSSETPGQDQREKQREGCHRRMGTGLLGTASLTGPANNPSLRLSPTSRGHVGENASAPDQLGTISLFGLNLLVF